MWIKHLLPLQVLPLQGTLGMTELEETLEESWRDYTSQLALECQKEPGDIIGKSTFRLPSLICCHYDDPDWDTRLENRWMAYYNSLC